MVDSKNHFLELLRDRGDDPVIVAHRGDSVRHPENTLEAASLAWKAGAPAWELDVQLTRDAVPIVLHDESLLRTTDVAARYHDDARGRAGFRVSDFDYDEIRALDAGSWFVAVDGGPRSARSFGTLDHLDPASVARYRSGRVTIPTLTEALLWTKEHDWLVNVEVKSFAESPPGLVERALEVIHHTGTRARLDLQLRSLGRCAGKPPWSRIRPRYSDANSPLSHSRVCYQARRRRYSPRFGRGPRLGVNRLSSRTRGPVAPGRSGSRVDETGYADSCSTLSIPMDRRASRNTWPQLVSMVSSRTTPKDWYGMLFKGMRSQLSADRGKCGSMISLLLLGPTVDRPVRRARDR